MRLTALLAFLALVPSWGQTRKKITSPAAAQIQLKQAPASSVAAKPAPAPIATNRSPVALPAVADIEKDLDRRISATGGTDRCVPVGLTRGVYVSGFGAVFTSEVDLINSPSIGLFQPTISPEQKQLVHKDKLAHVPMLQQTMREMLLALAAAPSLKSMAEADQIVVAVRLVYRPWEDTSGLPGQIVMRADRRGGNIRMELQ